MEVDLNKPRITEKKGKVIDYKEVVAFNKLHPKYKFRKTDIIKIMRAFNSNMAEETMINIYGVTLPENIGVILINNAGRSKKKAVNYAESKKTGIIVYHRNWETDNNIMHIKYVNHTRRTLVRNTTMFAFNPLQEFRKKASVYFKKNWAKCLALNYKSSTDINV
jgi:hypothetical protein